MGDLFTKDFLSDKESLFKNYLALDISFFPPIIKYRENEQKYIAECIKPLFDKRNGKNLIITGNPGIGKTLAVKAVFKELEEEGYDDEVKPIYINCWKDSSAHRIALIICNAINYKLVHNKNTNDLFDEIKRILNRKAAVICFDEADKIEDISAVYLILEQIYNKTLIFITNNREWLVRLDSRLKSRLMLENLDFRAYNEEEVRGILKQRTEYAFIDNVFNKEALDEICNITHKLNDIRSGLFLLRESGNIAESCSSRKINLEHAKKAIEKIDCSDKKVENKEIENKSEVTDVKKNNIGEEENLLYAIIKENDGKSTSEIHEIYIKRSGNNLRYRRFKDIKLDTLRNNGFIQFEEVSLGSKGRKTIVKLNREKNLNEFSI